MTFPTYLEDWDQKGQFAEPEFFEDPFWGIGDPMEETANFQDDEFAVPPLPNGGSDNELEKRHTLPKLQTSGLRVETSGRSPTLSPAISPRRAATYPQRAVELHELRDLLSKIGHKIEPSAHRDSSDTDDQVDSGAQADEVIRKAGCESWPVPTFFISGPSEKSDGHSDTQSVRNGQQGPAITLENSTAPASAGFAFNNFYCFSDEQASVAPSAAFEYTANEVAAPQNLYDFTQFSTLEFRSRQAKQPFILPPSDSGIGSSIFGHFNPRGSSMGGSIHPGMHNDAHLSSGVFLRRGDGDYHPGISMHMDAPSELAGASFVQADQENTPFSDLSCAAPPLSSVLPSSATPQDETHQLSQTAVGVMKTTILEPILKNPEHREFWGHCTVALHQMESGRIGNLRDLEKFLTHKAGTTRNSAAYKNFCREFLSRVQQSLKDMPQSELQRPYDRPYDQGYFLDALAQLQVQGLGPAEQPMNLSFGDGEVQDMSPGSSSIDCDLSPTGGKRHQNSLPEEESPMKRSRPNSAEGRSPVDQIALREAGSFDYGNIPTDAMATAQIPFLSRAHGKRRAKRKPQSGQQDEYSFHCLVPNCQYGPFRRKCDLTKHEKSHTRPHKCSIVECKYHTEGFPTDKERERHWRDKHDNSPGDYHCTSCDYVTKRESNCKQHMEKAHGWKYERTKGKCKNSQRVAPVIRTENQTLASEIQSQYFGARRNQPGRESVVHNGNFALNNLVAYPPSMPQPHSAGFHQPQPMPGYSDPNPWDYVQPSQLTRTGQAGENLEHFGSLQNIPHGQYSMFSGLDTGFGLSNIDPALQQQVDEEDEGLGDDVQDFGLNLEA